ncbi:hypothetical protein [Streptomyces sp. NPDC048202]|uniref:hypothetical protein n=1 Tax=Streptomyces sp. NPDC048202 TaxID=3365514 RepID=UPI003715B839
MSGDTAQQFANLVGNNAFAAIVGSAVTASLGYARWQLSRRFPARRTWRYCSPNTLTVVVASSAHVHTGKYARPTTGIGQVRAMSLLVPSLSRAYRDVDLQQVRLSSTMPGKEIENDLLVLGGTKNNQIAEQLLDRIPNLPFQSLGEVIDWGGQHYEGHTDGQTVTKDYGYVVRARNPFSAGRRIVILAGSHTFGTVAAARWLLENGARRDLPTNVAVLVEADVFEDGHVAPPRQLEAVEL